jgi:hypothetical protein
MSSCRHAVIDALTAVVAFVVAAGITDAQAP